MFAAASFAVGQIPVVLQVLDQPVEFLSIYQPLIYEGKEFYLIAPLMVGVFATWFVFTYGRWAMWTLLGAFLLLGLVVAWLYEWPATSPIHAVNWALSYCCIALFVAVIARATYDGWERFTP